MLPLVGRTTRALSAWLAPAYGGALELRADLDQVEALAGEREALWARLEAASFLTQDEKRSAAGYGEAGEGEGTRSKFRFDQPRMPAGNGRESGQWTREGGSGLPVVPMFAGAAQAAIQALLLTFATLSQSNSDDGAAILEFNSVEFLPGEKPDAEALKVGRRTRDEVDEACPRHGEVQSLTDEAANTIRREGNYQGPAAYGTKVHTELKRRIDAMDDPDFRAEVSASKSDAAATYGTKGSIRVDVLERVGNGTVCVYDIKTGNARLGLSRIGEIANNVHSFYPDTNRILVIEARPGK